MNAFRKFSNLTLVEQTLFALPFAYLGILFAEGADVSDWIWITVALTAARTAGMSFNRVIDAEIDAANPRTQARPVPKGEVRHQTVWLLAIASCLILIGAAYALNDLCFYLSFAAIGLLFTYSYFKRFSSSSHFYLGFVEAAAPIGGYLGVTGEFSLTPFILGFVIMMWIAGLDIVYSIQDMNFDIKEKLHSIPVTLGKHRALTLSATCYIVAVGALIWAGIRAEMAFPYWIGVGGAAIIFLYQQKLARSEQLAEAILKFFKANQYVSPTLLCGTAVAVAIH